MLVTVLFVCLAGIILGETYLLGTNFQKIFPGKPAPIPQPLLAYSFKNLKKTVFLPTQITLGKRVSQTKNEFSQTFFYSVPKKPGSTTFLQVSGLMNAPGKPGNYPVIVMFRGFVPSNIYQPGIGTQPVAQVLAENGFITLAPDFLGFGQSSSPSANPFENRFQTYTTALSLLASLQTLNKGLIASYSATLSADMTKIGIWGHSNGGHIALATLAISGVAYPTVVWAPVSVSFPYSILYYTDESDDQGMALRKTLAQFESVYNTDAFSPPLYYKWIKAPLQIDQGLSDEEVPYWWSENLAKTLKKNGLSVELNTFPNADHNMLPGGWTKAVAKTLQFYQTYFAK